MKNRRRENRAGDWLSPRVVAAAALGGILFFLFRFHETAQQNFAENARQSPRIESNDRAIQRNAREIEALRRAVDELQLRAPPPK